MPWPIKCDKCNKETWVGNIVDLQDPEHGHLDEKGFVLCGHCGERGYIEKSFDTQEGDTFEPHIKGFIRPQGYTGNSYQPFAFLVGYSAEEEPPEDAWFCYYKDMRPHGRLKMGHGPGGPPIFSVKEVFDLLLQMIDLGCLDAEEVVEAVRSLSAATADGPDSN